MTTLTDEQVAEIEKRHADECADEFDIAVRLAAGPTHRYANAHYDRAALLSHAKALKAEIAELRKAPEVTREKVLEDALRPIAKFLDRASKRHMGRSWSSLAKDKRVLAVWLAEMTPQSTPDCTMAELFEMHERANAALALFNSRPSREVTQEEIADCAHHILWDIVLARPDDKEPTPQMKRDVRYAIETLLNSRSSPGVQPARTLGDYKDPERARLAGEELVRIVNGRQPYDGTIHPDGTPNQVTASDWLNAGWSDRRHSERRTSVIGNFYKTPRRADRRARQTEGSAQAAPSPTLVGQHYTVSGPVTDDDIRKFDEAAEKATPLDVRALDEKMREAAPSQAAVLTEEDLRARLASIELKSLGYIQNPNGTLGLRQDTINAIIDRLTQQGAAPKEFCGMKLAVDPTLAPNTIEFHHASGRIDRIVYDAAPAAQEGTP